jgi:hypothetical protein
MHLLHIFLHALLGAQVLLAAHWPWLALQQVRKAHDPNFCFQSCSWSSSTRSSWSLLFCETCARGYKIKLRWVHIYKTIVRPSRRPHSEDYPCVCPKISNWMKLKSFDELSWWHHVKASSSVWPQSEQNSHHEEHKKKTANKMRRHWWLREKKSSMYSNLRLHMLKRVLFRKKFKIHNAIA